MKLLKIKEIKKIKGGKAGLDVECLDIAPQQQPNRLSTYGIQPDWNKNITFLNLFNHYEGEKLWNHLKLKK